MKANIGLPTEKMENGFGKGVGIEMKLQ